MTSTSIDIAIRINKVASVLYCYSSSMDQIRLSSQITPLVSSIIYLITKYITPITKITSIEIVIRLLVIRISIQVFNQEQQDIKFIKVNTHYRSVCVRVTCARIAYFMLH